MIKLLDKFLGKGLDIALLFEFILLNMAWILALAVPMAILVSTLMAFGRIQVSYRGAFGFGVGSGSGSACMHAHANTNGCEGEQSKSNLSLQIHMMIL